ncbi:MAG: sensor histidine kinase [Gemmatimonadaceae bacterium]
MTTGAPPIPRWPWLTRRRLVLVTGAAAAAALAIAALHRRNARGFLAEYARALPMSVSLSSQLLADWLDVRATNARLVAAAVGAVGTVSGSGATRGKAVPIIQAMVAEGGYVDGTLDATGSPADGAGLQTMVGDGERVSLVEFRAPVADSAPRGAAVVLRLAVTEATFPHFHAAAPDDRSQRTALLLNPDVAPTPAAGRGAPERPVQLIAASEAGGGTRAPATVSIPASLRAALDTGTLARSVYPAAARAGAPRGGLGLGLRGVPVVYATSPVRGTPWVLVREREVAELLALVQPSLLLTDAVFGIVALLTIGVLLLWWRAQYQRRETESQRLRAAFVAGVSHELRTPLTQVRMYAELLRLDLLPDPADRARALRVIEKESERLSLLIDRTLTFVRTGQAAPPAQDVVVLAHAVQRACDTLGALAAERRVQWDVRVPATLAVQAPADDVHQVLLNLLDNAIKYGPAGQSVQIAAQAMVSGTDRVRLAIRDQGPGIPAREQQLIWLPYRRGHTAASSAVHGTGIGRAVVRDLVERANGRVYVDQGEGADAARTTGATFAVELPMAPDTGAPTSH